MRNYLFLIHSDFWQLSGQLQLLFFPQRSCPKHRWKGGGVSHCLANIYLDCESAKFESSSKTSAKEPGDWSMKWPFAWRLKPRSSAVTQRDQSGSAYQPRLQCARQGRMMWHQGDQSVGYLWYLSLGALTVALSTALFYTPATLKGSIQGCQQ